MNKQALGIWTNPRYSIIDAEFLVTLQSGAIYSVDGPDFWQWVTANLPAWAQDLELVFGVPQFTEDALRITFAATNQGDPRTMTPPPACIQEWAAA